MRKFISALILVLSISCKSQTNNELGKLKNSIGKTLLAKKMITKEEFDNGKGFSIYGLHEDIIDYENLKFGIYVISTGSHQPVNFIIYEKDSIHFLDAYSYEEFIISLEKLLKYSFKKEYCDEIIIDYVSRLIRIHYNINRNLRGNTDNNCEFPKRILKSIFKLNDFKLKLVKELIKNDIVQSIDSFYDEPDNLILQKVDFYFGLSKQNENLEIGIYSYAFVNSEDIIDGYVLLKEENFYFLEMNNNENLIKTVHDIIDFGEENEVCSEKTIWLLGKIFDKFLSKSCFGNHTD